MIGFHDGYKINLGAKVRWLCGHQHFGTFFPTGPLRAKQCEASWKFLYIITKAHSVVRSDLLEQLLSLCCLKGHFSIWRVKFKWFLSPFLALSTPVVSAASSASASDSNFSTECHVYFWGAFNNDAGTKKQENDVQTHYYCFISLTVAHLLHAFKQSINTSSLCVCIFRMNQHAFILEGPYMISKTFLPAFLGCRS